MGMAVLAGGLAFVGNADATQLLVDGSFESVSPSSSGIIKIGGNANPGLGGGWSVFSTYLYSTEYALPGPAGSGANFLRPYASGTAGIPNSSQTVTQLVSLTASTTLTPAKIDAGNGRFAVSAYFSSYLAQGDYSTLTLDFLDASGTSVGTPVDPLGGQDFVAAIPQGPSPTGKYPDAKDWAQDLREGAIPAGAREALVTIQSTSIAGSPDGYVDLVSLDVTDSTVGTPSVKTAIPENNAIGVGPLVNLAVLLQDATTAVNTNSVRMLLDNAQVPAVIQQTNNTTTLVTYAAGLLQALSQHDYKIIFGDNATPSVFQTNQFHFTVADYVTLPAGQSSPLGSEDATKPGFDVTVYQVDPAPLTDPAPTQINAPPSISFSEAMLAGAVGLDIADLTGAASTNTFAVASVINYVTSSGSTANFPNDAQFPGIPGTSASEDSFANQITTFIRFPTAGYYQLGVNNEDQLRVTAGTTGVQALRITAPTNMIIPSVVIGTNITGLQFGAGLPKTPLSGLLAYATPSGNADDSCFIGTNTSLAGKIVLLDRGGTVCDSVVKAQQAQNAGAIAVIETTPDDSGFPFRLDGSSTTIHIPVMVIADNYGGSVLKSYATNGIPVTLAVQGDPNPQLVSWDGPKDFGAVDQIYGFAVPAPGVYPMRLVAGQVSGRANLEWFSIKTDGSRVLLNDTTDAAALRTFRARTAVVEPPKFNPVTLSGGNITLSWTGSGTLQETTTFSSWTDSPNQSNPQTVPTTGSMKYYRISQ